MLLIVPFSCLVRLHTYEAYYSGSLTLRHEHVDPKTFYFIVLNPYGGSSSEFCVYEDERMTIVYVEGIGDEIQGFNPQTGKPVTRYDFSLNLRDPKMGVSYVITSIISEAIYQSEVLSKKRESGNTSQQVTEYVFDCIWKKQFSNEAEIVAENYITNFIKAK